MVKRFHVSRERHFSAHHMFLAVARAELDDAKDEQPGWFYRCLTAMTMSALAVEALANAFGERAVEGWEDFERAPPVAKLRLVCKELKIPFVLDKEPWASIKWLLKFRNDIAHAKPVFLKTNDILTEEECEQRRFDRPQSDLEKKITVKNALRAFNAADSLKDMWCSKLSPEDNFGLYSDSSMGTTRLAQ